MKSSVDDCWVVAIMDKMNGESIAEITLADPSRKLRRIAITVPGIYKASGYDFVALSDVEGKKTLFMVDLPQGFYAGKSVSVKLKGADILYLYVSDHMGSGLN